jgi:hypothetical protein
MGDLAAGERNEMIWLRHGDSRTDNAVLRVLDGPGSITDSECRIGAIAVQPQEDFPAPSGWAAGDDRSTEARAMPWLPVLELTDAHNGTTADPKQLARALLQNAE